MKKFLKKISHIIEYLVFSALILIAPYFGIDRSSAFFGKLTLLLGKFLPAAGIAGKNLKNFYPGLGGKEKILEGALENFGRYIGEFAYIKLPLKKEIESRIELSGESNIEKYRKEGKPFFMFAGHFANWDIMIGMLPKLFPKWVLVYRKANNPYIDRAVKKMRSSENIKTVPKGSGGARELVEYFKSGYSVVMLVDQKMNEGLPVPLLGKKANTPSAPAKLALKYGYPLIPCRPVRKAGAYFKMEIGEEIEIPEEKDPELKIYKLTESINGIISSWILDKPEQWFWFHDRWGIKNKKQ